MNQILKKRLVFITTLAIWAVPFLAFGKVVETPTQLTDLITTFTNWARDIAGGLAVLFIILAGVNFIWNGGDPSKVEKAKSMILYAAIGLAIVFLAEAIKNIAMDLANVSE